MAAPKERKGWPKGKPRPAPNCTKANSRFHNNKTCAACDTSKPMSEFSYAHWRSGWKQMRAADPRKYRDSCKECTRIKNGVELDPDFPADRKNMPPRVPRVKRTASEKHQQVLLRKKKMRRKARIQCLRYLAKKGCEKCGERDPRVLEFDHRDPTKKKDSIAVLLSQGYSWGNEKLRREIRKCRVLCANCHRIHTVEQQGYYAHDDVKDELERIYAEHDIDPTTPRWVAGRKGRS